MQSPVSRPPSIKNNVHISGKLDANQTLLFVNGLGTTQKAWDAVALELQDRARIVRFDHVGSIPENLADFQAKKVRYLNATGYAKDLLELCKDLQLDGNTIAIGHSLGGLAALLASVERPKLFRKLVLLGVSPRYASDVGYEGGFTHEAIQDTYHTLTTDYSVWRNSLAQSVLPANESRELVEQFASNLAAIPPNMMLTVLCSVLQTDHREDLAKLAVPVMVIQSQNDIFVPNAVADFMHANIHGSTLVKINASGHLPHVTHPHLVSQLIRDFLGS